MAFLQDNINLIQLQCVSPSFHILMLLPQRTDLIEVTIQPQGVMQLFQTFSFRRLRCAAEIDGV